MEISIWVTEELYSLYSLLEKAEFCFSHFTTYYESLVRKYLGVPVNVPLTKKFNVKDKNPLDYIPSFDYEDRSFPLEMLFKEQFERAFNTDLSMVRIHTGEYSHDIASKHGAKAVTMGNSIFFARGMYDPYTEEGVALLAHEIQHVVQYNDKDTFFLYDEDIAVAEYMAESVEAQLKNMSLHSVNSNVLSDDVDIQRDNPEIQEKDSNPDVIANDSLDDFSSKPTEVRYNITTKDGKVCNISKKERAKLIEMTTEKVKNYISQEFSMMSDNEKQNYLMKVMKYVR